MKNKKNNLKEIGRKILRNAKDMDVNDAIRKAYPNAKPNDYYGVTACGEDLLVRRLG